MGKSSRRGQRGVSGTANTVLLTMLAAVWLVGCGYQLAGRGDLPGHIETLAVRMLVNHSSETGVETLMTNALITELNRRRTGSVRGVEQADAVLSGTIDTIRWDTVAHRGVNTASERRVYATISLTLTDHSGQVLWQRSGLTAEQAYSVVGDNKTATDYNRRQAIGVLAQRMAENIYRRLTDNF